MSIEVAGDRPSGPAGQTYEALYEAHAQAIPGDDAVGAGGYEIIGRIELDLLQMEGLRPGHVLVDFGCGNGRLAVHAVPALAGGTYVGIDISETLLGRAREKIERLAPAPPCTVRWLKQTTPHFPLEDHSVDMICAFSVFTHLEHEDSYRYLREATRVVRPGGRFIFSCLPLSLRHAGEIFQIEAAMDLQTRWGRVRNVTTSVDFMNAVARLAGWEPLRWYPGDQACIGLPPGEMRALGQSCCVLARAGA